ncbi:MAG TPA: Gfo/Idh/MocA family oxidoreductase [Bryobacteraceae bacterium]|nr:Gfo/Idh/MocA family oxidoreductase [Bryobacteraceae bacterium]
MKLDVLMIGGGMIAHDQILPSLYQLQRRGTIGEISVVAQSAQTVRALAENETILRAFPGHSFKAYPEYEQIPDARDPDRYKALLAAMKPRQIAVVALPDQLHYEAVMQALRCNQHLLVVKPLVLSAAQALEIEAEAKRRNLVVGVEYHKRLDDRSLLARRRYRAGMFGEFKLGTARLMEKWYYRNSNFQNWCTVENSDAFTYIGCHYVDLVAFVTGLKPVAVSVYGIKDRYPNGREGYLYTDARVIWENGACLNVQNSLSFPDAAPGTNTQGITMYFAGAGEDGRQRGGWLEHSDQYRGLKYCYIQEPSAPGSTMFAEPSTDYFQYVDLGGPGLEVVGYGFRSVEFIIRNILRVEAAPEGERQRLLRELDDSGVMATPANSAYNELVVEAGRQSIVDGGREVRIKPPSAA